MVTTVTQSRLSLLLSSTEFACGVCFPYSCDCCGTNFAAGGSATMMGTTAAVRRTSRVADSDANKSFLHPINQPTVTSSARVKPVGTQTNIEAEKQRHRRESAAAAAAESVNTAPTADGTCARCRLPLPSRARTTRESNATNTCRMCRVHTPAELSTHAKLDDLWVSIRGGVYDLTAFAHSHPGGILPLQDVAGCDASDVFRTFHSAQVQSRLPSLQVGLMGEFDESGRFVEGGWVDTPLQKDFHDMVTQLEQDGQFVCEYDYYYRLIACQGSTLLLSVALLLYGGHWAVYMASAFFLGMFWQQIAFVGHDLGHNSVRGSVSRDWLPGLLVTAFFGVSVQWWKRNHNVHHVVTNSVEHDPDIQHMPIFCISDKAFKGYYSTYYERFVPFDRAASWLVANQHYLYYPVMAVARVNLYAQSLLLVFDPSKAVAARPYEISALVFFWCWFGAMLSCLPGGWLSFAYFAFSHAVAGLTHVQITLSHFSMPAYEGRGYSHESDPLKREHFLRTQLATSMDVECHEWLDWLHGGLQFQVTHHLLPRLPRHRLRHVREKYVKPWAKKHGIDYIGYWFIDANKTVYDQLKVAAEASRLVKMPFTESYLWQFLNARG